MGRWALLRIHHCVLGSGSGEPPGWIENWHLGASGEKRTEKELRRLPRPWVAFHDISLPGDTNIDHLVVGPGGVFVLDSKNWSGTIAVDPSGTVSAVRWEGGPSYRVADSGHVISLATETSHRIRGATRIVTWVQPVVVVWADFPQGITEGKATYVKGEQLVAWLVGRSRRIADERIPRIIDAVRHAWEVR